MGDMLGIYVFNFYVLTECRTFKTFLQKKRKISTEDETSNKDVEVSVPPSSNEEPADVPPILDRYDDFNMNNDSEEESQPPPLEVEPPISDPLSDDDEEDTNNNTENIISNPSIHF